MMLDHVCQGPVILIASSLGAWVSFLEFVVLRQTEYAQKYLLLQSYPQTYRSQLYWPNEDLTEFIPCCL